MSGTEVYGFGVGELDVHRAYVRPAYPNDQTSTYSYFGNTGDRRVQTIHHRYAGGSTLSRFDYTYDGAGNILTWRQQADATTVRWEYGYDRADQMITALKKSTDSTPVILKRHGYDYDPAGNRLVEQMDDAVVGATYKNVNELVSQGPSGLRRFEGTVCEPAIVTVGRKLARVMPDNRFSASVPVVAGTNTVTITAVDGTQMAISPATAPAAWNGMPAISWPR